MSNPSNSVQLIGRLVTDPDLHTHAPGRSVRKLRLAVDGLGGEDTTGYIDLSVWHSPGEACARTLTKGWLIAAAGELQIAPWSHDERSGLSANVPNASVKFLAAPRERS